MGIESGTWFLNYAQMISTIANIVQVVLLVVITYILILGMSRLRMDISVHDSDMKEGFKSLMRKK